MKVARVEISTGFSITHFINRVSQKSVPVLILDNSKILSRNIKIRFLLKAESCSYLMVYAGLKLNFFIKARWIAKICSFSQFLVKLLAIC